MSDYTWSGLSDQLLKHLGALEFAEPTIIQRKSIPLLSTSKKDFIGIAPTGSGKTLAYALPILEKLDLRFPYTQVLILVPTRELVLQIQKVFKKIGAYQEKIRTGVAYGGVSISQQIHKLKQPPHILIATPGRLKDLIDRNVVVLKDVQTIVLDEADQLLQIGFRSSIEYAMKELTETPELWLFTATFPKSVRVLCQEYMDQPIEINLTGNEKITSGLIHSSILIDHRKKSEILAAIVKSAPLFYGIIFCRTQRNVRILQRILSKQFDAAVLHGGMTQNQREKVVQRFRKKQITLVIATDLASRGLDVEHLTHIVHFDFPDTVHSYIHRSGRTSRAGRPGHSVLLVPKSKLNAKIHIEEQLNIRFNWISYD